MANLWKKRRGKLGPFEPLLGKWIAEADSPMGLVSCERSMESILGGNYLQLSASWHFGPADKSKAYRELAVIGVGDDRQVAFWSFTSDGKRSEGKLADVTDVHPEAVGFEAEMPAGTARMIYWPADDCGFYWAVESKTKKGWNRFTKHHYHKV